MLIEGITLHSFDADRWVVHTQQERNFLVNRPTYRLIELLRECNNSNEAVTKFNTSFQTSLNAVQFEQLIAEKLGGYQILKDDTEPEKPTLKNQYLKLKVELINARWAGWLSKPFQVFYSPKGFWWALLGAVLTNAGVYFSSDTTQLFGHINYPLFLGLVYATMLIHELGHIGACAKYGLKHGGIGFGFYFVLPVMYADITNIWLANKPRRLIANLAGIFNEVFYAALLGIIYLCTDNVTFLAASIGIFSFVVWEFNPFVRFDGYWVLSDLTNTPNLLIKANNVFKKSMTRGHIIPFLKNPVQSLSQTTIAQRWLFMYGFINTAFWIAIMTYTLVVYWDTVVGFPVIVWGLIQKAIHLEIKWEDFSRKLITVLVFYLLAIRLLSNQFRKVTAIWVQFKTTQLVF